MVEHRLRALQYRGLRGSLFMLKRLADALWWSRAATSAAATRSPGLSLARTF